MVPITHPDRFKDNMDFVAMSMGSIVSLYEAKYFFYVKEYSTNLLKDCSSHAFCLLIVCESAIVIPFSLAVSAMLWLAKQCAFDVIVFLKLFWFAIVTHHLHEVCYISL